MTILPRSFYLRQDVVQIARETLGKYLVTSIDGQVTAGMICETEAYSGVNDKASHAYRGRRTVRTEIMYAVGGTAYIYLCYGIHSLFNIVTNEMDIPHAILIRGIIPEDGIGIMSERVGKSTLSANAGIGPGKVSKLLGIHFSLTGLDLTRKPLSNQFGIWLEDRGLEKPVGNIFQGPRILSCPTVFG
ncbi:MAG: DNA-3-methyladenine glycosylase [Bacteroidota bacterium]